MKKIILLSACLILLVGAGPLAAAEFEFHGDMNNRFLLYTNHHDWFNNEQQGEINDGEVNETYGELKYRFWFNAATNDGNVKGTYAVEVGGIRFGEEGDSGGDFSGDGVNLETRWAYLDLQLPGVATEARFRMGLHPVTVNEFLWQENAAGVIYNGQPNDFLGYQLGWIRGIDRLQRDLDPSIKDQDNWLLRLNFMPAEATQIGVFGLYQTGDVDPATNGTINPREYLVKLFADEVDHQIYTIGVDGGTEAGAFFVNWNLMYQGGEFKNVLFDDSDFSGATPAARNYDLQAYFGEVDLGVKFGKNKLTGTFWYASGDDNPNDGDFDGFLSTDLDRADNIGIFEGLYTDDNTYFTERPYLLDKGFVMFKLAWDQQATEKFSWGAAAMYMQTAEDIRYRNAALTQTFTNSDIGFELDAYIKYMIYSNVEFKLNAGYLTAGDALDAFESDAIRDGSSDEDIWGSSMRIRYKF
jgi:hypothetical protein